MVLGDGWSACLLYYDDACGMHASPFPLIASAFGGFQVFHTNCGGLWHRTRADGSAFVRFTHTHTGNNMIVQPKMDYHMPLVTPAN